MSLICWSALTFLSGFVCGFEDFFFLLFLIISFFRGPLLKGENSHLLEAVQINWLLCPLPCYNGVVFLPTSVSCCGVAPKIHGLSVTAVGIHIWQLHMPGLSKIAPGRAAKCLKTLAALAEGLCWWPPQCKCPESRGQMSQMKLLGTQGCPSTLW